MPMFLFKQGVYPLRQAQAIHQHYKCPVGSYQPAVEPSDSTYLSALVMLAHLKESRQKLLEPHVLADVLTGKVCLLSHPTTKRYRLVVLYQLVDQPEQYHFQDLRHLLGQCAFLSMRTSTCRLLTLPLQGRF